MKGIVFYIIILIAFTANSQEQSKIYKLIKANIDIDIKEKKLDLFFGKEQDTITPLELAECYHDYATDWFYRKKRNTKKAIIYIKKALYLKSRCKDSLPKTYKKSLYNLGFFYKKELNYFNAINIFEQIVDHRELDKVTAKSHKELGVLYSKIGDFSKAQKNLNIAERFCSKNDDKKNELFLTTIYLEKIRILSYQGYYKYKKEITFYLDKVELLLKGQNKISNNRLLTQQIRSNLLLKTKDYKKALIYQQNIVCLFQEYLDSKSLAIAYNNIGVIHHEMDDYDKAEFYYKKAIETDGVLGFLNYGELKIDKGLYKEGLSILNAGIIKSVLETNTVSNNWNPSLKQIEITPHKLKLLKLLIEKSNAYVKYYEHDKNKSHLTQAIETFKLADKLVDIIRTESTEYKSKLFWREKSNALYLNAVKACYYLDNTEMAFYFMEKNKALLLLEDVTNEQAKINSNLPITVAKKEFELKRNIYLARQQFLETKDSTKVYKAALQDSIFDKKRHFEKFIDSIGVLYPKYAANKKEAKVLSVAKIKQKLKRDNQALLQYIIGEEEGYLVYGTNETMTLFSINNVPELQLTIKQLLKQLQIPLHTKTDLVAFKTNASAVYNSLIPEVIQQALKGKNVIIIPDQVLQKLPFEALVNKKTDGYFIEDSQISYAYSMSHLEALKGMPNKKSKRLLAFAPVNFSDKTLPSLPLSAIELQKISAYYPSDSFTNKDASKKTFLEEIKNHNILHLSTHAELGENGNPWIAFADKKMSLNEIYATKMTSDMVVLSACQTALGDIKIGEGVMSLARGFFSAGTKSVVSSLWSVNDKANTQLMTSFYTFLSQGDSRATALHKAKLNYLNTHKGTEKSPHYWASLILIGESGTLTPASNSMFYILFGFGVFLLLFLVYVLKRKRVH